MPLGATSTLLYVRSNVRSRTKTEDVQFSGLVEPALTDFIHQAVVTIRGLARFTVQDFYYTEKALTLAAAVDLSSISIFDVKTLKLILDSTKMPIPIVPRNVFDHLVYVHNWATGQWIATVTTGTAFGLKVGGAATPAGAATLAYERNPAKEITDANVLDIPDQLIPQVIDMTCLTVWRDIKHQQPQADAVQRVRMFVDESLREAKIRQENS